ncbi:choline/ethanolamine kinase family protein [Microbispora bryophytorum]|uniref:Phosphotransferase family protein n=1 Tax=Microbispora bryophytorum subsp. camponoti TaxID=1677852 RepID=A0ABR8LCT5_9ACTN|nr:choline/ethanolamine kinase family protein [Microbispora camponoti]MBD3147619.1 phosphotransferase family protein [Microbispora camponoti]
MPDPVADAMDLVTAWAGRPLTVTTIKGGLSHHIARLDSEDGDRWLLRVLDPRIAETGLGIPLDQEIANTVAAAASGIGPRVVHVLPGALLLEYVEGVTLDAGAVAARIEEVANACRRLHAGPRFGNDFSIFGKLREYVARCRAHDLALPSGYEDVLPVVADVEAALARRPLPTVPCHNDLLAENLITTGDGVRIVDYQLSGNNDPCFELGDLAAESDFDPDQVVRLTRAYFGDDEHVPRVRLNLIMSNLTWALWFVIHEGLVREVTLPGFDYSAEAADKFAQAVRDLGDPRFGRLLDGVRKLRTS